MFCCTILAQSVSLSATELFLLAKLFLFFYLQGYHLALLPGCLHLGTGGTIEERDAHSHLKAHEVASVKTASVLVIGIPGTDDELVA